MKDEDRERARAIGAALDDVRAIADVRAIVDQVAQLSGIPAHAILSPSKKRAIARARQLVMFIARRDGATLTLIGQALNRDHTSVLHGVRAEMKRRIHG